MKLTEGKTKGNMKSLCKGINPHPPVAPPGDPRRPKLTPAPPRIGKINIETVSINLPINTENINPFEKEYNIELIIAKAAYDKSIICKENVVKGELHSIMIRIKKEIEKGNTSFYLYNKTLLEGTQNKLKELGYKIEYNNDMKNESSVKISWS